MSTDYRGSIAHVLASYEPLRDTPSKEAYADGFRVTRGGVPCEVYGKKLPNGRYVSRASASATSALRLA